MTDDRNGLNETLKRLVSPGGGHDDQVDIEGTMKQVSIILSVAGFGLMVAGLVLMLLEGASFSSTNISALAPLPISDWSKASPGLAVTSVGIILVALLPIVRVLLALRLYWKGRNLRDAGASAVVLAELLVSIVVG